MKMNFATSTSYHIFLWLGIIAFATLAHASSDKVKVRVYSGPKKCDNSDPENPLRIEEDYVAGFHFTVTIDESSTGSRENLGKKIESSHDMGIAPSFPVGQGKVIAGLDQGLIGLCKGASAYITVPPHLGYGVYGKPESGVGPDSTLRYDVEIITVQAPVPNDFKKIDKNKDWKLSKGEVRRYFKGQGQAINVDALWSDEDKNDDGFVSWDEFSGPKGSEGPPQKNKQPPRKSSPQQQQQAAQALTLFQNIDKDEDDKVSKAEMANMFEASGKEMSEDFWKTLDPDGNGSVTLEEWLYIHQMEQQQEQQGQQQQQQQQQQSGQADVGSLFSQIDVDKDGKINKEELGNMFKSMGQEMTEEFWRESDPDNDGYILYDEFVGGGGGKSDNENEEQGEKEEDGDEALDLDKGEEL